MVLYQIFGIDGITTLQKSLFSHTFYEIHICFLLQKSEGNSDNKNRHGVLMLRVIILLQYNAILVHSE